MMIVRRRPQHVIAMFIQAVAVWGCASNSQTTANGGNDGSAGAATGGAAGSSSLGSAGLVITNAGADSGGGGSTQGGASASSAGSDAGASAAGASAAGASAAGASAAGASAAGASAAGAGGSGTDGGSANNGTGGSQPMDFFARYEAESPLNSLTYPVERIGTEGDTACPEDGVKEGAVCASGGKVITQILGRSPCNPPTSTTSYDQCQNKGGGVTFNQVNVPADGIYDVTWWYHCGPDKPGHADVYGDANCGGLNYETGPGSGCRPQLIDVNGTAISASVGGKTALYFQFPCYPSPWSTLHGATTQLPLKAGPNTISMHAPGATTLDAVDLDAIDLRAKGRGTAPPPLWPKLVTPVVAPN